MNASALPLLAAALAGADAPALPDNCGATLIHFGGAIGDRAPNATAFRWRAAEYMVDVSCGWMYGDAAAERASRAFLAALFARLRPACDGAYVNFIDAAQGERWARDYYGANLERLQRVKRAWNPRPSALDFAQAIPDE